MNIMACFKGDYVSAIELEKPATLTIDRVEVVELQDEDGKTKSKPVVFFNGTSRGWVLCKTTAQSLAALFSNETTAWHGKRVTIFAQEVQVGREKKPGIRVKGSPDIGKPVSFELKLPRRKPQTVTLVPT